MKQPELGKKISELRKVKGLTQEELVDKCNLSVRTLQRIEAGEVEPRIYTVRILMEALDYNYEEFSKEILNKESSFLKLLEQYYKYFIGLFNLKTNTMKKITILSIALFAIIFGLSSVTNAIKAQSTVKRVEKTIKKSNDDFIKWFNNGEIDLIVELYRYDACLVAKGCGKTYIKNYYQGEFQKYKYTELTIINLTVSDTVAVEKGRWKIRLESGDEIGGEYLTEWRRSDHNKWLMVSDLAGINTLN